MHTFCILIGNDKLEEICSCFVRIQLFHVCLVFAVCVCVCLNRTKLCKIWKVCQNVQKRKKSFCQQRQDKFEIFKRKDVVLRFRGNENFTQVIRENCIVVDRLFYSTYILFIVSGTFKEPHNNGNCLCCHHSLPFVTSDTHDRFFYGR